MSKKTWLEEQIISAKQETENWSEWKREAMRIDDQNLPQTQKNGDIEDGVSVKKRA